MSEESPSTPSLRDLSSCCLLHLEYSMAGDLDSGPLLQQLREHWHAIDWNSPGFVSGSEEMQRSGELPLYLDAESTVLLRPMAYSLIQRNAQLEECWSTVNPTLRQTRERVEKLMAYHASLLEYIHQAEQLHVAACDRLETLSDDPAPFALPAPPAPPNF